MVGRKNLFGMQYISRGGEYDSFIGVRKQSTRTGLRALKIFVKVLLEISGEYRGSVSDLRLRFFIHRLKAFVGKDL